MCSKNLFHCALCVCICTFMHCCVCVLGVAGVFSDLSCARGRDHHAGDGQSRVAVWFEHH